MLFLSIGYSQVRIDDWKALTSPLNVRDLTNLDNELFAATEGGLFHIKDQVYETYTTVDGILGVDLAAIDHDHNSNIWIGGNVPFGFLQVYDPKENKSIISFDFDLTGILDIQVLDSLAFVLFQDGQDFGIMKFLYNDGWEYRDSFRNFPEAAGSVNCFLANDSTLFIGTNYGIYLGNLSENLKDPNRWQAIDDAMDFEVTSATFNDSFIAFSSKTSLYELSILSGNWEPITFSYSFSNISEIIVSENVYWIIDQKKLYRKSNLGDALLENRYWLSGMTRVNNQMIVGALDGLLFIENPDNGNEMVTRFLPNAPVTSGFSAITVLDDGRLVGGSAHGISIYSDEGWRNILEIKTINTDTIHSDYDYSHFIADTIPHDFGGFIADLEQGPDGLLYCAIRGSYVSNTAPNRTSGGIIILDVDDPSNITVIDTTYLSFHTTQSNSAPFMVVLDIEFDLDNNMWVANPYCINGNMPIHVRSLIGDWKHYGSYETSLRISQSPGSLAIDSWNRVWYSAFQAEEANLGFYPNGGIFMLSYEGNPVNPSGFSWKKVQNNGTVWSLGMGTNDRIYYLTASGLNYFDITNSTNPVLRENAFSYFPNISFGNGAEIKIDPHGNVWAHSPSQGIHILLENTTYWPDINGLRADNSPLLSDEITDIAFDEKRSLAYIATSKGVNILRIPFGEKKKDYSDMKVFPSPFYIPSVNPMKVDGLPLESSMMVMTLDGKVVRHVPSRGISIDGNQLSWDGRDNAGDLVSSGIYLLAIYGMDGSQSVEKVTVIKE